jgi:DNA-binding transcriptional regulator YdaS (Cro superfamily)
MFGDFQNYVKTAVQRLGGPTKTANAMTVSNTTIHDWINKRRISDINQAKKLAELTGLKLQDLRSTL